MNYKIKVWVGMLGLVLSLSGMYGCKQAGSGEAVPAAAAADSVVAEPAVKIGYLNSLELFSLMPEIAEADQAVAAFAKRKERTFNNLANQYQTKIQDLQQNGPAMLKAQQEAAVQEIQGLEQRMQQMQANTQAEVAREKERLYAPILARADSVIKLVGEEQGYTFIYDAPGLLYADTTLNILPTVAKRMGLSIDEPAADSTATAN